MRSTLNKINVGTYYNSISRFSIDESFLTKNSLIIGDAGSGKKDLSLVFRNFISSCYIPTFYISFKKDEEIVFKNANSFVFNTDNLDSIEEALNAGVDINLVADASDFCSDKKTISALSALLSSNSLLDNYFVFIEELGELNTLFNQHDDFIRYFLNLFHLKSYGMIFVSNVHDVFNDSFVKTMFSFQFIGRISEGVFLSKFHNLPKNDFLFVSRKPGNTFIMDDVKKEFITIENPI